jgi:hypothetical protein
MSPSKNMIVFTFLASLTVILLSVSAAIGADDPTLKPFVLASSEPGTIDAKVDEIKAALAPEGFQVVGDYQPYQGARILVVTSEALKNSAAKSKFGAYGAIQRISITETAKGIQVAYTNPLYMAQVYRMNDSLAETAAGLEKALGKKNEFGSEAGIKASKLRSYHYMIMMPYFTDPIKLATYKSQDEATQIVETNLAARKGGTFKVYRVDVPGKKESVFGVGLTDGDGADAVVMKVIDKGELKHTAHLPYELVVSGGVVYMLHGRFRIASDFPDLTMGTFMKISGAPSDIENKLKLVATRKD